MPCSFGTGLKCVVDLRQGFELAGRGMMWSSIEINRGAPQSDPIRPRNSPVLHPGSSPGRIILKDLCSYTLGAQNGSHGTLRRLSIYYVYVNTYYTYGPPPIVNLNAVAPSA